MLHTEGVFEEIHLIIRTNAPIHRSSEGKKGVRKIHEASSELFRTLISRCLNHRGYALEEWARVVELLYEQLEDAFRFYLQEKVHPSE